MIGRTLLHYTILEKLGKGGMGEVWVAEDAKLKRKVALKLLPPELAGDPERRARFAREAQAIAALNHPNIVTVHSVEQAEGLHFITMELVPGKALHKVIPRQGLSLDEFFHIGVPLADAVSAAHQQGITHRDIKPENVMVSDEGRVKVLDFGLAKLREEAQAVAASTQLPTASVTEEGKVLGTVAYMSPEQAEGKPVDHRSDLFSLGVVLYQMATGQRPFKGDTSASIISSILRDTPAAVSELNQTLPRHLGRIVRHCLQKNPELRYQSAKDLRNDLQELKEEIDSGETLPSGVAIGPAARRKSRRSFYAPLAIVAAAAAVIAYLWLGRATTREDAGSALPRYASVQLTSLPGEEDSPSLSPDGKAFVYVKEDGGDQDIFFQRVGGEKAINVTEDSEGDDAEPAFSPDGERIAFRSDREGGGVFVMGATGESVRRVTDFGYSPAWSPDGASIALSTGSPVVGGRAGFGELWTVDLATGERRRITDEDAVQPSWSPHGHRIAYWSAERGRYDIATVPAAGGESLRVTEDDARDWTPAWSHDGRHLYFSSERGGSMNLWRAPMDERTGERLGDPQPVTTGGLGSRYGPSVSSDGARIAYVESVILYNIQRVAFDPVAEAVVGENQPVTTGSVSAYFPAVSPDGEWLAYTAPGEPEDIYVMRVDGTERRRLTRGHKNRSPRWSPDGQRIVFQSNRSGSYEIWTIRPDGSGLEQMTDDPTREFVVPLWSPEGSRLFFVTTLPMSGIYLLELGSSIENHVLRQLTVPVQGFGASSWSSNGRRLAGNRATGEGDFAEMLVYSLDDGSLGKLLDFGREPLWLADDRRLLFRHEGKLFMLDTESLEHHEVLALDPPAHIAPGFDLSRDNRWIYYARRAGESDIWMLELE